MRIQLDTDHKTIKVESTVKFSELIETLEKLLPKGLWKEFSLETNVTINSWTSPIVIRDYTYPRPWYHTAINAIGTNVTNTASLQTGTYNIEC